MKTNLLLIPFFLISISITAQKITLSQLKDFQILNYKKNITLATEYGDSQTKVQNILSIISLEGENSSYKDSLAIAYFQNNNFLSAHLTSKELLIKKPNNVILSEINAISLTKLNATKEAIDAYEKLFLLTNKMSDGYQLAFLQYSIKRLSEAKVSITRALECEPMEKAYLQFPVDKNSNQNVPLKAAAYNLKGLISFELKEYSEASTFFNESLKIMPEFATATQNANAVLITLQNEKKNNTMPVVPNKN